MNNLNKEIQNNIFHRVYLLKGEEGFLRKLYAGRLREALCGSNTINYNLFNTPNPDLSEIMDLAGTMPFLGDKRVIVVEDSKLFELAKSSDKGEGGSEGGDEGESTTDGSLSSSGSASSDASSSAGALASSDGIDSIEPEILDGTGKVKKPRKQKKKASLQEVFVEFIESIPDTTCIVFSEEKVDKRSKLYKKIEKAGCVADFPIQDHRTLASWVGRLAREERVNISPADAAYMVKTVGTDMTKLKGEFEKLCCYAYGETAITAAHIDAVCSPAIEDKVFDMIDDMSEGRSRQAFNRFADLIALEVHPLKVLSLLERHFRIIYRLGEFNAMNVYGKEVAGKLGVPPFTIKKYSSQLQRYKVSGARRALEDCADTERGIKSGRLDARIGVELLIAAYSL